MTTSSPTPPSINAPQHVVFRRAILLFALLLGLECIWLELPLLLGAGSHRLPSDPASAAVASRDRRSAARAASIGVIRGDLWTESAFTYTDLILSNINTMADPDLPKQRTQESLAELLQRAHTSLDHALSYAPHESGAWLLLAALAARYHSSNANVIDALKMSYYTGPSDPDLMALRLHVAARCVVLTDVELRELITRDVRLFLARNERSAIAGAYDAASPQAKQLIEQTISDLDPSALKLLRAGAY
jgi:hypothetical protein